MSLTIPADSPEPRTLTVTVSQGIRVQRAMIRIADRREAPWLRKARQALQDDDAENAWALVQSHLAEPMSPSDRAQATSLMANIAIERNELSRAIELFEHAMEEDRVAGLVSGELEDALALTSVLGQNLRRFDEVERLLRDKEPLFARLPYLQPWRALQWGLFQKMRGDLQGALPPTEAGMEWAERFGDRSVLGELHMLHVEILQALGRTHEALTELDQIPEKLLPPCRRAGVLQERGWVRLVTLEALPAAGPPETGAPLDPRPFFQESLSLYRQECNQRLPIASVLTGLARAALLYGRADEAASRLRDARAAAGEPDAELLANWIDLEGQVALVERRLADAAAIYRHLLDAAYKDPGLSYGSPWRGWVGLAQAREASDVKGALAAYRKAEEYLDERGRAMPLGVGRGGFLGLHERSTALYLDLLDRLGRRSEALEVLRHARVRGLLAFGNLARASTWSDKERETWRAQMEDYHKARLELEQIKDQEEGADETTRQALVERQRRLEMRLPALAAAALQLDHWELPSGPMRKAEPGEILLACHPVRLGWLCLAEKGGAVMSVRLDRLDGQMARGDLERQLLTPLAPLLGDARALRVLPFGAMRQIDFASLSWEGRRLGDRLAVRYALDLPPAAQGAPPTSTGGRPTTLLLVDPQGDIPGSKAFADEAASLLAPHWQVDLHRGAPEFINGTRRTHLGPRLLGGALSRLLASRDLFFYYGHSDFLPTAIRTADRAGLTVSDILVLERVPRWVVLAGCESGRSDEEAGGLEGVGLAQAFLLRGSAWVIGSVRLVDYKLSAALALALLEAGLDRPGADPIVALERARGVLRERLVPERGADAATLDNSLDAFRVFVL
ncbi:MAG TPA: CHAT domain-containing protein [Polyangia bacterium]|nr:CHAT domain-containing protein [Polyangia bacterium]